MKNQYAMTESQVEALAHERTQSLMAMDGTDGTYLRVLLNGAQAKLGPKRGRAPAKTSQIEALEVVAVPYYAAVLRGVTTPDIALGPDLEADEVQRRTRERNRRAIFARTAKSTLSTWVDEGGDLRALNVTTVTKSQLRAEVQAARSERGTTVATRIERAKATIVAAVAHDPPEVARERLEDVIEAIQKVIDELPANDTHHETTTVRTRAGAPSFREPRVLNRGVGARA